MKIVFYIWAGFILFFLFEAACFLWATNGGYDHLLRYSLALGTAFGLPVGLICLIVTRNSLG